MTEKDLLNKLQALSESNDSEFVHGLADEILLDFCKQNLNDVSAEELDAAWNAIPKRYS